MLFQSAVDLQSRVFREVFDFKEVPLVAGFAATEASTYVDPVLFDADPRLNRRHVKQRKDVQNIALGVTQSSEGAGADAKLAVLVQTREELKSSAVDKIVDLAKREAEVLFIGRQKPFWPQTRCDPLKLGCSISPVTVAYSGTLGCFCHEPQSGATGILSNNHVLADVNRVPVGTHIMQPGALDSGVKGNDDIAELLRFVPIQFGGVPNMVDCAVARLIPGKRKLDTSGIHDCSVPPKRMLSLRPAAISAAVPGMAVFKTGRTTCHTAGRVAAVNVNNYIVNMGVGIARFDGQVIIGMDMSPTRPFSRPGDSGSIIVDNKGQPVGLLFAGSNVGGPGNLGFTAANPISSVVAQLGVTLI